MLPTLLSNRTRLLATFEDLIQKSTEPIFCKVPWKITYIHRGHVFHRYNHHPWIGKTLPSLRHVLFNGQLSKVCGNKWFINTILWLQGVNWAWTNDRKMVVLPTFHLKSLPEILILLPLAPFTMHGNTLMTIKNQKSIGQNFFKRQP